MTDTDAGGMRSGRPGAVDASEVTLGEQTSTVTDIEEDRLYRLLAENATDAIVWIRGGEIAWASPSLEATVGWRPDEWLGRPLQDFTHPRDVPASLHSWSDSFDGTPVLHRFRVQGRDGVFHWVEGHAGPLLDESGHQDGFIERFRTIDDLVAAEEELSRRARLDNLTGLLNRGEMLARIASTASHAPREGTRLALLFCDIDQLKPVNDGFGHIVGDEVLRQVAARITAGIRAGDQAARMGGDEFIILLDGVGDVADAVAVAEKIRAAVAEPMLILEHSVTATVSIGVAMLEPGQSVESVIALADTAMYQAKHAGRNRVTVMADVSGDAIRALC